MARKNAKSQALRVRRAQKVSNSINHLNRSEEVEGDGTRLENQPIRTGGEDCTRHNSGCSLGGSTVGGILRELIDEVDEQSAYHSSQASYHNSQLERLSDRRRHLKRLYQELQDQAGEDNDMESEDKEELEEDE